MRYRDSSVDLVLVVGGGVHVCEVRRQWRLIATLSPQRLPEAPGRVGI